MVLSERVQLSEFVGITRIVKAGVDEKKFLSRASQGFLHLCTCYLEGNLFSTINGVDIVIDATVQKEVAGLDMGGVRKFDEMPDGYNKMQTYRGILLDPVRNLRNCLGVGGLTNEDKMLVYLITYILTPRSCNHAQVIDDDLQIVYGLKSGIKMNWVLLIEDIMLNSRHLVDYEFPYDVLVSRFINYFNVDASNEIVDFTKYISRGWE